MIYGEIHLLFYGVNLTLGANFLPALPLGKKIQASATFIACLLIPARYFDETSQTTIALSRRRIAVHVFSSSQFTFLVGHSNILGSGLSW
jgi:hypothetical protein